MIRVVATGTFDGVHPGHVWFLRQAKALGGWLGVVIARDITVWRIKGRKPRRSEAKRLQSIKKLRIADRVVLGQIRDPYAVLEKLRPSTIALGYDQRAFTAKLREACRKRKLPVRIVRIAAFHPEKYKSSLMKRGRPLAKNR